MIILLRLVRIVRIPRTPTNGSEVSLSRVSPSVSRDQYTALSLVGVLITGYGRINNIINYIFTQFFFIRGGVVRTEKDIFQSFLDSEKVLREIGLLCPEMSSDPETRLGPSQSSSYLGLGTIESVLPTLLRSPGLGPNSLLGLGPSSLLGLGP